MVNDKLLIINYALRIANYELCIINYELSDYYERKNQICYRKIQEWI